jgi:hypothetical protein
MLLLLAPRSLSGLLLVKRVRRIRRPEGLIGTLPACFKESSYYRIVLVYANLTNGFLTVANLWYYLEI